MEKQNKEKIRFELIGLLQPDSNIRSCLKSVSLPDEWVVTQEYFVRRNEILGVLSYGVSKKGKIHKVNFWNSSANYYVPENAQTEKILNIQIQEEISYLENTLVDFLILISSGEYGWNIGNGIIRILRNKCFYSIFTRDSKLYFSDIFKLKRGEYLAVCVVCFCEFCPPSSFVPVLFHFNHHEIPVGTVYICVNHLVIMNHIRPFIG